MTADGAPAACLLADTEKRESVCVCVLCLIVRRLILQLAFAGAFILNESALNACKWWGTLSCLVVFVSTALIPRFQRLPPSRRAGPLWATF